MAIYYSLKDGIIQDATVFGNTLTAQDLLSTVSVSSVPSDKEFKMPHILSKGETVWGMAINLSALNLTVPTATLTLKAVSGGSLTDNRLLGTKTFNLSNFTSYRDISSDVAMPMNWQLLQFDNSFTVASGNYYSFSLKASDANQLYVLADPDFSIKNLVNTYYPNSGGIITSNTHLLTSDSPFTDVFARSLSGSGTQTLTISSNPLSSDYTIDFWFKPNTIVSTGAIDTPANYFLNTGVGANSVKIGAYNNRLIFSAVSSNNNLQYLLSSNIANINLNSWNHIAITRTNLKYTGYVNGVSSFGYNTTFKNVIDCSSVTIQNLKGLMTNLRVIDGISVYNDNNYTVVNTEPYEPLFGSKIYLDTFTGKYNRSIVSTFLSSVSTDKASILNIFHNISTSKITNLSADSINIHNKGVLNFDTTSDNTPSNIINTVILTGASGLRVLSDGTFNMGTSADPLKNVIFGGNINRCVAVLALTSQITVHNGGNFNVYGASVNRGTFIIGNDVTTAAATINFNLTLSSNINNNWALNDIVYALPVKANANPLQYTVKGLANNSSVATLWSSSLVPYKIYGTNSLPYYPILWNTTANAKLSNIGANGGTVTTRPSIRFNANCNVNINNAEFANFGTATKNPIILATSSNANINISSCSFKNEFSFLPQNLFDYKTNRLSNLKFNNNVIVAGNIALTAISLNSMYFENIELKNNSIINSPQIVSNSYSSLIFDSISGNDVNAFDNYIIYPKNHGVTVRNIALTGSTLGGTSYYPSTNYGLIVNEEAQTAVKCDYIKGGSIFGLSENVVINTPNISSTYVLKDVLTLSGNSNGLILSGNDSLYTNPAKLNINGLIALGNAKNGIQASNVYGSLSNLNLQFNTNNNLLLGIGNRYTVIDTMSSIGALTGVMLSACTNYDQTSIRNSVLSSTNPIILDSPKLEYFSMENSVLCGNTFRTLTSSNVPIIKGSYSFNSCYFKAGTEISSVHISSYQSDVGNEIGFSVTKLNGLSAQNYKWLKSGRIGTDNTKRRFNRGASEKLTPTSDIYKLRSGIKSIPINANDLVVVNVSIYKSVLADGKNYVGSDPRIILKSNGLMGYTHTVLSTVTGSNGSWIDNQLTLPVSKNNGYAEIYVECMGTYSGLLNSSDCGSIYIDGWSVKYGAGKYWYSSNPSLSDWTSLQNWYLDSSRKFPAAAIPSYVGDVIVQGNVGVAINLDDPKVVLPKSITTNTTVLSVYSNADRIVSTNLTGTKFVFKGNVTFGG